MQQPYVLGIDIGTGSTKAVAVTPSGTVIASAQAFYSTLPTPPVFSEQDPETIWQAFVTVIQKIGREAGPPLAVSLSSCMHSLILLDETGRPLTPNLTWADRRSATIAEALRNTAEGEMIYKATGTPLHAMSPLCKLKWFQQHGDLKKFSKAVSIKEYIWYKLFAEYEVDASIASATGLFDVQQLRWFAPALDFCGITETQLSKPVSTKFIRKNLVAEKATLLNLPAETPFCIGASDGCLANVGSDALQPGIAAITIGTSGAVRIASSKPVVLFPEMLFNYRLDESTFICGGAVNNGGNIAQWLLKDFLKNIAPEAEGYKAMFEAAACVPAGAEGLLCLPYLNGERTPLWHEKACGVFFGVRPHHNQAHFIRAALEGVCFGLYGILKKLETATTTIHSLHVSGGVVHTQMWLQLLADITGKNVSVLNSDDASAVGAALFCFKALDIKTDYAAVTNVQTSLVPNAANHRLYSQCFALFQDLYAALKPAMHRLYDGNAAL